MSQKDFVVYMPTKKCFILFMKNIKTRHLIYEKDIEKKVDQIDKAIFDINNNLDKMYMDKLQGIILEEDYIRGITKIYI